MPFSSKSFIASFITRNRFVMLFLLFNIGTCFLLHGQHTSNSYSEKAFFKYALKNNSEKDTGYYLVKYNESYCGSNINFRIARKLTHGLAIIKSDKRKTFTNNTGCVERMEPANDLWKLSATLDAKENTLQNQNNGTLKFTIIASNIHALLATLSHKKINFETVSIFNTANAAVIKCKPSVFFTDCLPEPDLLFGDLFIQPTPDLMVSGYYRNINKINEADYYLPGANGSGITIGIKEKMMDETDIDLQKRILPSIISSKEKEFHANVIATLAGGAGNSFYTGKGPASKCIFFPSSFSNLFPDSTQLLTQKNVTVQNHAYGTLVQQFYGAEAVSYDLQSYQNSNLLHIFSSGNKGADAPTTGTYANLSGFANLTGNFKMAKNVITVAAVDTGGNVAPFSSSGPLFDGRLAPQITALGPNGTSEAAAIVSGAAAVLQQVYKDSNALRPAPSSLIKAVLFTTTEDIGNKGIDYKTGFGLLNIFKAVTCLQSKQFDGSSLADDELWTKNLVIPQKAANLKISLVWTDTAASVNTNKTLVNDLDLELKDLTTGIVYKPWSLSVFPHADSLNSLPERKRDSLNTAEQVSIELPSPGMYQVRVNASQIQTISKQSFHVAWRWDTLHILRFTNPVHTPDVDKKENPNLSIQWKVAVADTNTTGNLSISFDGGNNWQTIGTGIKIYKQLFNYAIPGEFATAQLRMETSFGNFFSERFMIAPLTKINVDYVCSDSLRLSWQKHFSANGYRLYALGDTAFIKPVLIVTDTFAVLPKKIFPYYTYAVEPLLAGGLFAARSVAVDVRKQGVDCLYKTLLAERREDSIELHLELGFLQGVSHLQFEKLSATGSLIKTISNVAVINGVFNYMVYDNEPAGGLNYYRVKIICNGGAVYTYTVSLLHNGKKQMLVYPNPVAKGQNINYRIKESAGNVTMVITDITGRILLTGLTPLAGEIKTTSLARGIYFITIRNNKGANLSTEKIIIQ